ncbi:MAG TPA: glycosyltransferase family 2 protein [Bacteriovoracaceae bacterium]|nr:glycosyltransferase family 2 protein [Bacteriovoracaceae bacterium]
MKDRLSIVIPVYNASQTIERLINVLFSELTGKVDFEVILVNDYSPDDSWNKIEKLHKAYPDRITGINLSKNYGEHNAVMAGYHHCSGDYIVNIDDDFQNPPSEILKMLDAIKEGYEVVYAQFEKKNHSLFRNLGSWFNGQVARHMLNKPADLYIGSFRIITRNLLEQIKSYVGPYPYIDGLILRSTSRIKSIPVAHNARAEGQSSYTLVKLLRLWSYMFLNFSVKPLRMASLLGLALSLLGFIYAIYVIVEKIMNPQAHMGYASIMTAILIISGVQLIMLGLLGEYIGRIFISNNNSPQFTVFQSLTRKN